MLWHPGINIHFVVLIEPQSSEICAFFRTCKLQVAISTRKYNVHVHVHEYPHTKVFMHVRDQHGKEKTLLLLFIT